MKTCNHCNRERPTSEFYRHATNKDGRRGKCKECYNLRSRWVNMIGRCHNPDHPKYEDYGGRGVYVCDEWRDSFDAYYQHVTNLPCYGDSDKPTLARINNKPNSKGGGYRPGNLQWASYLTQRHNQRPDGKRRIFHAHPPEGGYIIISSSQSRLSRTYGLRQGKVSLCLNGKRGSHKGWKFEYTFPRQSLSSDKETP